MTLASATVLQEVRQDLTRRLIDALIREDVANCCSGDGALPSRSVPGLPSSPNRWLRLTQARGTLWIPVLPATFMQRWRWSGEPSVWQSDAQPGQPRALPDYQALLSCLAPEEQGETQRLHALYSEECQTAERHGVLCRLEQQRWFDALGHRNRDWFSIAHPVARMGYFERLAAFLDHPLYPSARAKNGFNDRALRTYAPEFDARFQLRWLAIPRSDVSQPGATPAIWPDFEDVGLDRRLDGDYSLVPVHPHLWETRLEAFLAETTMGERIIRAPKPALWVRPTLSVRTLEVETDPGIHIKVPLTIRTLGNRNIRTIKPSTIYDGYTVQNLLEMITRSDPALSRCFEVVDESTGLHAGDLTWLGYIVRRFPVYPSGQTIVPVAALLATDPEGRCVAEVLAGQFNNADLEAWVRDYVALTLNTHLRLWLAHGVALESNQQNSMVVFEHDKAPRLLFKDNDAPRLWPARLAQRTPSARPLLAQLKDSRIAVDSDTPLAQMFTTITLQLNLAVILEGLAARGLGTTRGWYRLLRSELEQVLDQLDREGIVTDYARDTLLEQPYLYTKYLLRAGSLESKSSTGAVDINKFYGRLAPNFLTEAS